jgi:hypothetical protein
MIHDRLSLDAGAFDDAIRSQGVIFVHHRAMKCPVGSSDVYDTHRPHPDHSGCSNGFILTPAGKVTCLFINNSKDSQFQDVGIMDFSTVQAVVPRLYDDNDEEVLMSPFDRLYLSNEGITVVNWEQKEHTPTGIDKLTFPVVKVQDLIDNLGNRYQQDRDFQITNGSIQWSDNNPGVDPETGRGRIFSIRYLYTPFFYVKRVLHELRVAQIDGPTGRELEKMPQAVLLQREFVFQTEAKDNLAPYPNSLRQAVGPDLLSPEGVGDGNLNFGHLNGDE